MARTKKSSAAPISIPPKNTLWGHQKDTLKLCKKSKVVFDMSDPGTGKTRAHLQAWVDRRRKGGGALLVLAPKSLLQSAWGDELDKYFPDITYSVAYSTNRAQAFIAQCDVYITNIDAVKWLAQQPKKFFARFDTLIIDELTVYKHHTSLRSKAAAKIRDHFSYRCGLTGTPNPNTILDVWHQAFILDGGQRLGDSFFKFRAATCTPVQVGPKREHIRWDDKEDAVDSVSWLLRDITIRHEFDKCMDIPPNTIQEVSYYMPRKLKKIYDQFEATALVKLRKEIVSAVNAAVLRNKLLQIASGAVYTSEDVYETVDKSRYDLICDLVEQRAHSIVFYNWKHQKEELLQMLNTRKIDHEYIDGTVPIKRRTEIVRAYQAGEYQTLLLHPQTGAHGLTLTKGTATIWSSPIYQADFLKQGLHRIFRGGQTQRTETILVKAAGTVEIPVYARLNQKSKRMEDLLEMLENSNK